MKKILILLLFISTISFAQVTPSRCVRVANNSTAFGETIPRGTIITDATTGKVYSAFLGLASTKTIATCTLNSELIDLTGIQNTTTQQTSANFNIDGNGVLGGSITAAGGGFNSLRSLKNIQTDWNGSALIELMKFKPRVFNYKQRPNVDTTFAFIIDELPVSIKNYILMAHGSAINIYSLHGFEIKAIQELTIKNQELEARIEKLEKLIK